jgi:hypothetical protein
MTPTDPNVHAQALQRAIDMSGSVLKLCRHLDVSVEELMQWVGARTVPEPHFLKVVACSPLGRGHF